jgi:hypothetical protein
MPSEFVHVSLLVSLPAAATASFHVPPQENTAREGAATVQVEA